MKAEAYSEMSQQSLKRLILSSNDGLYFGVPSKGVS